MNNKEEIILGYPKIAEFLLAEPDKKNEIIKIIKEIQGDFKGSVVSSAIKFIDNTFMHLYDREINLDIPEGMDLKKMQDKYHLVMVPNHQSHADYVALTYIFYKHFQIQVYVAAGINLKVFLLGDFFKRCGAFFIRRSFANDYVYKITFEAYVYYLLTTDKVVEFFFEGGRTRTGKLLKPKFGLFSMLLEAHEHINTGKKLMFIPVSIAHEHVPEEKAHAKELFGAKKEKEKATQLLKLFKLFSKKLGTLHVRLSPGFVIDENYLKSDLKTRTQRLAFDCFKSVGKGMPITPSSLLALIMLDDPQGVLTWEQIQKRAEEIVEYCKHFNIPMTSTLEQSQFVTSLKLAMDMFINNKKVELVKKEKLGLIFYTIKDESRVELLFHKNMILHHFLVPYFINSTLFNVFNGKITGSSELTKYLIEKRNELKYEFYLPTVRELIEEALKIIEYATGKKLSNLKEALALSHTEFYSIAMRVRNFSTAFSYIYEGYYVALLTVKYFSTNRFTEESFLQASKEIHSMERIHGRVVKYPESYSVSVMKDALLYLKNQKILSVEGDKNYLSNDPDRTKEMAERFAQDISDQISINLKFN